MPGAQLEHLVCFINNSRLQDDFLATEKARDAQAHEVDELSRMRAEEVDHLTNQMLLLRRQLGLLDLDLCDDGPGSNGRLGNQSSQALSRLEEEGLIRRYRARAEELRLQIASQRVELEEVRKQLSGAAPATGVRQAEDGAWDDLLGLCEDLREPSQAAFRALGMQPLVDANLAMEAASPLEASLLKMSSWMEVLATRLGNLRPSA